MRRWIFEPAKLLLDTGNESVDFAVLGILNAVPEMLAKCQGHEQSFQKAVDQWNANKQSSTEKSSSDKKKKPMLSTYLYRRGIEYIFPDRKNNVFEDEELIVDLIYGKLRCGLAHFAFAGERILLSRNDENLCSVLIDDVHSGHMPGWSYRPPLLLSVNMPEWYNQTEKCVGEYINRLRDTKTDGDRRIFSDRITRGEGRRKGSSPGCMCGKKQFCVVCASVKFPASHRARVSMEGGRG